MAEIIIDDIERKNKRKGFYTSLFLHIIILVLAIIPFLTYPDPPPGQEGILVNLGMPDVGQGEENAPAAKSPPAEPEPEPKRETPPPPPEPEPEPEPTPPEPEPIPEPEPEPTPPKEVITDDNSKEIALKKEKERQRKEEERQKRLEKERKERLEEEAERKKKAEQDAKRKREQEARRRAEEEAREKAEEERRAREAAEAKRKAEAAARAEAEDLIGGLGGGSGSGKGNTGKPGNQGNEDGKPNSDNLEGVSAGAGSSVGGGLGGRGILNAPKVNDDFNKPGRIVLKVCVDSNGTVTEADFTQRGSTTTDSQLVRIAKRNAMKYRFSRGSMDKQCGTITYVFKVK